MLNSIQIFMQAVEHEVKKLLRILLVKVIKLNTSYEWLRCIYMTSELANSLLKLPWG